ncbi:MAG: endolytic transglycosylase MltG, partial [Gemmatimonadetes bacterium]|nr:endolytic transglycosylase MltG [Gemmatimonadota bacterium]
MHSMLRANLRYAVGMAGLLALSACGGQPEGDPVRFTVPSGSGMIAVADTLANREIIRWPTLFRLYARQRGAERTIKPGTYEMQRGTAWSDVLDRMVAGDVVTLNIVVPEGWTAVQIGQRIAEATGTSADSVVAALLDETLAQELDLPGPTLEGYLYPATYILPVGVRPRRVIETMVNRYRQAWTPELRERADSMGLSEREVVT